MALNFYELNKEDFKKLHLSKSVIKLSDFDITNAKKFYTYHDSTLGTVVTRRLFLHNDDTSKWYKNVRVFIDDNNTTSSGEPYYVTEQPLTIKLHKGWIQPDTITWMTTEEFNVLVYNNIGMANSYDLKFYPFWIVIECEGETATNIINELILTNLTLRVVSEEFDHGSSRNNGYFK